MWNFLATGFEFGYALAVFYFSIKNPFFNSELVAPEPEHYPETQIHTQSPEFFHIDERKILV